MSTTKSKPEAKEKTEAKPVVDKAFVKKPPAPNMKHTIKV